MQLPVIIGRATDKIAISDDQAKDLFYRILNIDRQEYGYDWIPTPPNISWSCTQRTTSCYITSTGDIKLCNSTNIRLGNIRDDKLRDVLLSSEMQALRDLSRVYGNCAKCPYLGVYCCAGCSANTFSNTRDVFASDDRCWHKWHT